ncbi:MAG: 4a-hydroxytetrahydrobiopterin dehydratase [Nitrososphaeria archaeon]|jgi:4a-hydroxytetrahydrobiopterin dehydratase
MVKMTENDIKKALSSMKEWSYKDNEIYKEYVFNNFMQSVKFVNIIAPVAESVKHHPDIFISYNKVRVALTTHDEGGVTEKDIDLAKKIDSLSFLV